VDATKLRDTKTFYLDVRPEDVVAPGHLSFVQEHAGRKILDFGCATGGYCLALAELGFTCTGVDVNAAYVERARERGVDVHLTEAGGLLPFAESAFDTVLLFEVLEHVENYEHVLREARRVARKNVLITVPNCARLEQLQAAGVVFDHTLDQDHVNFFTPELLSSALGAVFPSHRIEEREFVDRALFRELLPRAFKKPFAALCALGLAGRRFSYRLFASADV
jgi:SAM-dependent methyltransferase